MLSPCLPFKFLKTNRICRLCAITQNRAASQRSSVHLEHLLLPVENRNGLPPIHTYSPRHSEPVPSKHMEPQVPLRSVLLKPRICKHGHAHCHQPVLQHLCRTSFIRQLLLYEVQILQWLLPKPWMLISATASLQ